MQVTTRRSLCFTFILVVTSIQTLRGQDDFEKWKKNEEAKYQSFVEERDKEFVAFLKHEWKQMQLLQGLVPDEQPKPVHIPVYVPPVAPREKDTAAATTIVALPPIAPPPEQPAVQREKPKVDEQRNRCEVNPSFFGVPVKIYFDERFKVSLGSSVEKEAISRFWEKVSEANFRDLLKQSSHVKREMNLNDWGYLKFLHAIAREICQSENEAILLTWFLSSKSGYETKVGFSGDQVCLLVPSNNTLFNVPFFTFDKTKRRFYLVSLDPKWKLADERIFTYEGSYPEASMPVAFSVSSPPTIDRSVSSKVLRFSYAGQKHDIPVKFSRDAIRFFEYYPQTNFEVYFGASPSTEAATSLLTPLREILKGKTEREAVNILLRFVQTAFEYKTDPEQFGREKPLFPDETLYYGFSDCEDRAILFAYLVRGLLGLDVIGLDYPAHVATAVRFTDDLRGDAVSYRGKKYIICDPTYTNADAGACMPDLKSINPKVITWAANRQ